MGTNYYMIEGTCPHCGRGGGEKHIGKCSAGWCFALHVYPDEGINTLDDWRERWEGHLIVDEYGDAVDHAWMLRTITEWEGHSDFTKPLVPIPPFQPESDWSVFLYRNHAEPGPNGLMRHKVDGRRCIGHGEGTWDYLVGDFS